MILSERIEHLEKIFDDLQSTNSRIKKEQIIKAIPAELKEDFQYILEILAGKHKLGYTYRMTRAELGADMYYEMTFKEYIQPLFEPMKSNNFTDLNIILAMNHCQYRQDLIASIVNRTLRLGIGPSRLPKDGLAPMLAKVKRCPFCGKVFSGYGNNCSPVITDPNVRCCDDCNVRVVIPKRMEIVMREDTDE